MQTKSATFDFIALNRPSTEPPGSFLKAAAKVYCEAMGLSPEQAESQLAEILKIETSLGFVVFDHKTQIAVAMTAGAFPPDDAEKFMIHKLAVRPAWKGLGLGILTLDKIVGAAFEAGAQEIASQEIDSMKTGVPARLYLQKGFAWKAEKNRMSLPRGVQGVLLDYTL